jgi:predicted ribosomally synthesized peptide with nif11-like leader
MSVAAAKAYLTEVASNEELRTQLEQASAPEERDTALIGAKVYVFTPDELLEAQSEFEQKGMFTDAGANIGRIVDWALGTG